MPLNKETKPNKNKLIFEMSQFNKKREYKIILSKIFFKNYRLTLIANEETKNL